MSVLSSSATSTVPTQGGQTTFGQMKTDVCAYYGLDGDPDKEALAGRMIGDIIDDLNRKKLWQFNLITAADITTVAGTASYAVPADLWRIYNMRKSDTVDYLITGLRESSMDIMFQSQNGITGYPYVRSDFNIYRDGTVKLFPTPDAAYTIKLRYFGLILKPSNDSDVLNMPSPYQTVPKYGALAMMGALVGSPMTAYWEGKYNGAYKEMNDSDESQGDEELRIVNVEELAARWSFVNPNARSRLLDMY